MNHFSVGTEIMDSSEEKRHLVQMHRSRTLAMLCKGVWL